MWARRRRRASRRPRRPAGSEAPETGPLELPSGSNDPRITRSLPCLCGRVTEVSKIDHGRILSCAACLRDYSVSFTTDERTGEVMVFLSFLDDAAPAPPEQPDETQVAETPVFGTEESEETRDDLNASTTTVGPAV